VQAAHGDPLARIFEIRCYGVLPAPRAAQPMRVMLHRRSGAYQT
jgi:hypothetical protein